jgi:HlyD family secretion protein
MDGTVTRLKSQKGERVVGTALMSGTEIMTIANLDEMEARVDIGEVDVILIALGQKARLEVDAMRDRKFTGTVTEIANAAKGTSAGSIGSSQQEATKFEVKIRINEKDAFRPGMSVTAEVETRARTNVLTVPIQSVTTRLPKKPDGTNQTASASATNTNAAAHSNSNLTAAATNAVQGKKGENQKPIEVVFLVEGDQVKMTPVKRGISDDSYVEITDGLKEAQEVVTGGYKAINRELEDGKKIKVGPAMESDKDKEEKGQGK